MKWSAALFLMSLPYAAALIGGIILWVLSL